MRWLSCLALVVAAAAALALLAHLYVSVWLPWRPGPAVSAWAAGAWLLALACYSLYCKR